MILSLLLVSFEDRFNDTDKVVDAGIADRSSRTEPAVYRMALQEMANGVNDLKKHVKIVDQALSNHISNVYTNWLGFYGF